VVGAPALRRAIWVSVTVLAAGVIVVLASHGRRPDTSLVGFQAAGIMLRISPDSVTEVTVSQGERRWRFERGSSKGWSAVQGSPPGESIAARIDSGLRFLHASAPQRVLRPEEVAGTSHSEFGLDPPRYSVSVRSPAPDPFTIEFGAPSPHGPTQYARVAGRVEILLLPRFVGEQWEGVMGAR
jgi:hypothetical protein